MPDVSKRDVPEWMEPYGVQKGEYLTITKMQLKAMQRPGAGHTLKQQVWATGILHTSGYRGERAVTLRHGQKVPLTHSDIVKELHKVAIEHYRSAGIELPDKSPENLALKVSKEHIRRVFMDLETDGKAERRTEDGRKVRDIPNEAARKLSGGKILLYFFLKPRAADAKHVLSEWNSLKKLPISESEVHLSWLPLSRIRNILKVLAISVPSDRKVLMDPLYQEKFKNALQKIRAIFLAEMEAPLTGGPMGTMTGGPIDPLPGGTFETVVERKPEMQAAGTDSAFPENPAEGLPPAKYIQIELAQRQLYCSGDMLEKICRALTPKTPPDYFIEKVDQRRKRGEFGTGLLPKIAEDAAAEFRAVCGSIGEGVA